MKLSGKKRRERQCRGQFSGNFVEGQLPLPPRLFHFCAQNPVENNGPRRRRPYGRVVERLNQDE